VVAMEAAGPKKWGHGTKEEEASIATADLVRA
jgi:hypothetical protein